MRVVFLGSGAFAVPSLEALLDAGHEVAAVVTQPDREKGRGRSLSATPAKVVAERRGVPVLQPRRVKEPAAIEELRALHPDVQVVVAYGQILPRAVIDIPPLRTVNVHSSLLPRYRGAAPIQWAVVNGERETGVTTMRAWRAARSAHSPRITRRPRWRRSSRRKMGGSIGRGRRRRSRNGSAASSPGRGR